MMVKPREVLRFDDCSKVESLRRSERQSRKMTLICFDFEANRNVSRRYAVRRRWYGRYLAQIPNVGAPLSHGSIKG